MLLFSKKQNFGLDYITDPKYMFLNSLMLCYAQVYTSAENLRHYGYLCFAHDPTSVKNRYGGLIW